MLILVNDAAPPEAGTGGKGASVYVGEYYAQQRGVPSAQVLHLNIPLSCCDSNPVSWDSWNVGWDKFDAYIRQPVKKFLADNNLTNQIDYIVPTYGIPVRTRDSTGNIEGLSVDSFLSSLNSGVLSQFLVNPYSSPWNEGRVHFHDLRNAGWKMYIVARLDGPSAEIAAGLVDKAIHAETNLKTSDGIAYFDYRHIASGDPYYFADQTVVNAYNQAASLGFQSVFNDNHMDTASMIHNAPNTLWAWGWYSGTETWDGYRFVEGAVGAQLTSYSANNIRDMGQGTWVPLWLKAGITATWGATTEPFAGGYANGDNLFQKLWSGYNFGEAAYMASPYLNHAMVFVGDPLYAPQVFRAPAVALASPAIASAADGGPIAPGGIATITGTALAQCIGSNTQYALSVSLCGAAVTIDGQPAPLFYASPTQLNVLVPRSLQPGRDVPLVVTRADGQSAGVAIPASTVPSLAPAIFVSRGHAIVQDASYGLAPIKPGDAGVLYATGLGPLDQPLADTALTPPTPLIRATGDVRVWINGTPQNTLFAGLTPLQFGLYQVNFVVDPATVVLDGDANFVWLTVNGVESAHQRITLAQ